ncbi:MAG: biopolymer transporter ExbD [Spirochaetales bacterium]|nr:biopolymer transporter ExbD [Spirochaetales bacterium]
MIEFPAWEKHRKNKSYSAMFTPLMDIMFLLLLFFILTSVLPSPALPVSLSEAETGIEQTAGSIAIIITKEGTLLFENQPVTSKELPLLVSRILENNPKNLNVILAVDRDTPFHFSAEVMDLLRKQKVNNISLLVKEPE